MGHEHQQVFLLLAPAAGIPLAQFYKIDRAVLHRVVGTSEDLSLVHVDLHERSRPDQRVESEIFKTDVAVERARWTQALDQTHRDVTPDGHDSCEFREARVGKIHELRSAKRG